jgi:hypothetical protein
MEVQQTPANQVLPAKLSRRKSAQIRRTEPEKTYKSVQNPCSPFYGRSAESAPDLAPSIRPASSVVEHVIGNDEVGSSILPLGTNAQKTTERGALSEMEVMVRLARLGASVWTPAFGQDHSFDLIAHWNGCMSRVQVKTMRDVDDNSISLSGTRVIDRAGGKQFPVITADDCDVIIGYHPGLEMAYVIRPVGKTRYTLRKNPAKNGQIIGIMYETDFRLTSLEQIRPQMSR